MFKAPQYANVSSEAAGVGDRSAQTDNASTNSVGSLSLPKGGGAIRGIGEKFAANQVTGTGSMRVPIATSPGRSGFGPQLSLSYDSGAGNGPFGFGWALSLPSITRKTDKGLPRYFDADDSDVFVLSGAEDLVPVFKTDRDGNLARDESKRPVFDEETRAGHVIRRYRPRIEGLFARIERWTRSSDGDTHWRSISKDNITSCYGKSPQSRIADPADQTHVFSWLICESYDDKGNAAVYEYKSEDSKGLEGTPTHEQPRNDKSRSANRYLKKVRYGNRQPNRDAEWNATEPAQLPNTTWMFEVLFDYGEGHYAEEPPDIEQRIFSSATITPPQEARWPARRDHFSTYRAGFEVRTYRLCRRVLMFHHFATELGIADCLVRSTDFTYQESPVASFITSVTQSGYVRRPTQNQPNRYLKKSLPSLEYEYSKAPTSELLAQQPVLELETGSLSNLPAGVDGTNYQWLDLDGEGTSGILTEQADGWYYKRNLSATTVVLQDPEEHGPARFGPTELITPKPAAGLTAGGQFLDLAGDGQVDLVRLDGPMRGFYERTEDASWAPFQPFTTCPDLNMRDPNLRFVDLTGDGHADILISEGESLVWYPSLAEEGFGPAVRVQLPKDEEAGPSFVFADEKQSIYLADLSGDGLSDLVRIRNGEICYWPNLGYGRFGSKVTMDNAPWFDSEDQFDQRRLRLADTDGSGTTDIFYIGREAVRVYFNQSGNSWSEATSLPQFPAVDNVSSLQAVDLLGNGTACLVLSTPLPATGRHVRYLSLMDQKPHLLIRMKNNLGAETRIKYSPSTRFYLDDERDGKPWLSRLPFPVHVVERVETLDHISGNRFVTQYSYHHGYFDGFEREFRGFGMVEQLDTEAFSTFAGDDAPATNSDAASHVPPVLIRTWFHTGIYLAPDLGYQSEYYREPGLTDAEARGLLLPDTVLPAELTPDEEREASRALKGVMLRQEIYALDGSGSIAFPHGHPYVVTEQNHTIRTLQRQETNRHGVFLTQTREAITYHYDRQPADPRVGQTMTLEVDDFGNVLKSVAIGYGRRERIRVVNEQGVISDAPNPRLNELAPSDRDTQKRVLVTYSENRVTNAIDRFPAHPDDYRAPLPAETRTYELTGYVPSGAAKRFQASDFVVADPRDPSGKKLLHRFDDEINYEDKPGDGKQRRLIEHVRTLYRKDDLTRLLGLGELEPMALTGESYKLAFTVGLLTRVFRRDNQALISNAADLLAGTGSDRGGYVDLDGNGSWWIPSGRTFLSPSRTDTPLQERTHARENFFLLKRYRDPFHTDQAGTETIVSYDDHKLLMLETRDALNNVVRAESDYRVLAPRLLVDPNGNRTEAAFDALGMVVATALRGKADQNTGDLLEDFDADPPLPALRAFISDPRAQAASLLGKTTTRVVYDADRFRRAGQPPFAATMSRETHLFDPGGPQTKIQINFSYSDGFSREIQKKIQAEAGVAPQRGPNTVREGGEVLPGALLRDANRKPVPANTAQRWVGSGRTIFNNKGKPVKQYEPFFSSTHLYEEEREMTDTGVSPVLFYDPLERVVATLHANHTWEKIVFNPWQQAKFDVNDTVKLAPNSDDDVKKFFLNPEGTSRISPAEYLPTWDQLRTDPVNAVAFASLYPSPADRLNEAAAATKAQTHALTSTLTQFDSMGRIFLTVAHNRFERDNAIVDEKYLTRAVRDIEGNLREVVDAKGDGRIVVRYDYDMLGNRIHQLSMEAGERWILNDVSGKPIRMWDSRQFLRSLTYDELRRQTGLFVTSNGVERLAERIVYGEAQGPGSNHRTRVFQVFDAAGRSTNEAYDFKGNLLRSKRELLPDYKAEVDWRQNLDPNDGSFTSITAFDALNRVTAVTAPDQSIYRATFNEANLLDKIVVKLRGADDATPFVTNIDYNSKGQRTLIRYGNGAETTYEYDDQTFRLTRIKTTRPLNRNGLSQIFRSPTIVQDLHYTYDPAGNVTHISDDAVSVVVRDGQEVLPACDYKYDSLYRLIEATGREHIGQTGFLFEPPDDNFRDYPFAGFRANANDLQALRNYTERYQYDPVGNFDRINHDAVNGTWTRTYAYNEQSLIEPGKQSNRLTSTTVGQRTEPCTYDAHGNVTKMSHLTVMQWDFKDQLHATSRQVVNNGTPEMTFYVYDAAGERVRKVTERQNGRRKEERIYLNGFEIFREFDSNGNDINLERETLHIMDDKQRIAFVETLTRGNGNIVVNPVSRPRYQLSNHVGSACLEFDKDAGLISYEEYHPYGTTSFQAMSNAAEVSLKRYRYTSKERDDETGFSHHGARYYAPWFGRWISCDPNGISDGSNVYAHVRNSPTILIDPSGRTSTMNLLSEDMQRTREQDLKDQADDVYVNEQVTKEEVADLMNLKNGDMIEKYGWARRNQISEAAHKMSGKDLARALPQQDQTVYLQPSGRQATDAQEQETIRAEKVANFNPGTPIGGVVRTGAYLAGASPETAENLGKVGDLAEGLLPAATATAARVKAANANKQTNTTISGAKNARNSNKGVGTPTNRAGYNSVNPADKTTGEINDENCIPSTAAAMKNINEKSQAATAENIDPSGTMKNIGRAGQGLKFVSNATGLQYDETPIDMKSDKAVAGAASGHYALIARTKAGGHMVYAQKTESGKFVVYDAQHGKVYTLEQFRSQYSDIAGYHFHSK
jgi:RHS repeat-associated protein